MKDELDSLVVRRAGDLEVGERVFCSFKGSSVLAEPGENSLRIVASTMGTADDRSGDVIFPGAYGPALAGFLKNGFIGVGHEWDELPIAIPTSCEEQGNRLICTANFHSTPSAQEARTVCRERMEAGKSVSVSVGFMPDYSDPDGVVWFGKGADLLAWAKGKGFDLSAFDQKGISRLGGCRAITRISEFFEVSLVGVGMNRGAKALAVKSGAIKSFNSEGQTFDEQFGEALGCLDSLTTRWESISTKRSRLGEGHRAKLAALLERLEPIVAKSGLAPEPAGDDLLEDAEKKAVRYRALTYRTLALRTALMG